MSLKYYFIVLSCKFGGKPNTSKERKRKTKSFRQGCPFKIYIALSDDGQSLEVITLNEEHNHTLSKEVYDHLPRQRAVPDEVKEEIREALYLQANTKLLQQKVKVGMEKR